jgi:lipoprotein-releasing system permease protein
MIAWRYFRRPTDRLVSAAGLASLLGLVIGVLSLVVSMALMTGYRLDLEKKLRAGNSEIFLYSFRGPIEELDSTLKTIRESGGVAAASPVIFHQALVASESSPGGEQVMLKGIDPARATRSPMMQRIIGTGLRTAGSDGEPGIAVGHHLAKRLRIAKGDALTVTVATKHGEGVLPRSRGFIVANVYETGFHEFDSSWIFLDLDSARALFEMHGSANLIEIDLTTGADLDATAATVASATGDRFAVTTWKQMNGQLFELLKMQQFVLFIVLGLIVFVSTFNIVSTLVMTAHEKRQEIGILASMGATQSLIRRIFVWYGLLVGIGGTAIGIGLGVVVCWVLTRFELVSFGPEIAQVYFVSSIPFVTRPSDLAIIAAFTITVSLLASLIPSARAARLRPVEALRHE